MSIRTRFNVSYSAYSLYKQSPLQFYFQYIAKATPTNKAHTVYGEAGNVVHQSIEAWLQNPAFSNRDFEAKWLDAKIDEKFGMFGTKLSFSKYITMFEQAKFVVRQFNLMSKSHAVEKEFKFQFCGMTIKGIVDLEVIEEDGSITLYDWKTDSAHTQEKHHGQRLFYSWAYNILHKQIPTCKWAYLATQDFVEEKVTPEQIEEFESEIVNFIGTICNQKRDDIRNYDPGDWKGPFNVYADLCAAEINSRNQSNVLMVKFIQKGNFIFVENAPQKLLDGFDLATKFDLPDKYFIQEAVKKKARGKINVADVGTVHLFNGLHKCFPMGLLPKIKTIVAEYEAFYNQKIDIEIVDARNQKIMNQKLDYELVKPVQLRDYQLTASRMFDHKKCGIIKIPTGGGKTITAVNIINQCKARTLWVIDRKELLKQTYDTLVHFFGEENVGHLNNQTRDYYKPIMISTVQFLSSWVKNAGTEATQIYFNQVNMLVIDEFHKSAAETYQKLFAKFPNTKYRLGLTATPQRDDGKEPILFSQLGEIIFEISEERLMSLGYLSRPTIIFNRIPNIQEMFKKPYADDYRDSIVESDERNKMIRQLIYKNPDKKILVLTKQIDHAQKLLDTLNEDFKAVHIHGTLDKEIREMFMDMFKRGEIKILFITLSIGAEGLDIPDLDIVINAAANKGDVKSTQVLGRVLRTFEGKTEAIYHDFVDHGYHTLSHSHARVKLFESKGYKVTYQ